MIYVYLTCSNILPLLTIFLTITHDVYFWSQAYLRIIYILQNSTILTIDYKKFSQIQSLNLHQNQEAECFITQKEFLHATL